MICNNLHKDRMLCSRASKIFAVSALTSNQGFPFRVLVALPEITWVLERVRRTFSGVPLAKSDTPLRFRATPRQCMRFHSETI